MGEGLVGLGHLVGVLLLLDRVPAVVGGVHQLAGELVAHRLLAARLRVRDDPSDRERRAAVRLYLDRHLVRRAADAARLDLEDRLDVLESLLEGLQRIVGRLLLDLFHGSVENGLGRRLLPALHHAVDELRHELRLVERIRENLPLWNFTATRHDGSLCLGALRAVLAARLLAIRDADRVERSANDVVAHAGKVFHAASANHDARVLLQVVADARDVRRDLDPVREPPAGALAERRVRLFRGRRLDLGADAPALRAGLKSGRLRLVTDGFAALPHELADRRHESFETPSDVKRRWDDPLNRTYGAKSADGRPFRGRDTAF